MTRAAFEMSEADALLLENTSKFEHVRPEVLMAEVFAQFCDARREQMRYGGEVPPVMRAVDPKSPDAPRERASRRLTEEQIGEIRALLDQGHNDGFISRETGVSRKTVLLHRWKYADENRAESRDDMHAEAMREEKGE